MTKVFCDRCGTELPPEDDRRYTLSCSVRRDLLLEPSDRDFIVCETCGQSIVDAIKALVPGLDPPRPQRASYVTVVGTKPRKPRKRRSARRA